MNNNDENKNETKRKRNPYLYYVCQLQQCNNLKRNFRNPSLCRVYSWTWFYCSVPWRNFVNFSTLNNVTLYSNYAYCNSIFDCIFILILFSQHNRFSIHLYVLEFMIFNDVKRNNNVIQRTNNLCILYRSIFNLFFIFYSRDISTVAPGASWKCKYFLPFHNNQ